ncbi:hypothetical protein OH491_23365 [Termitidicoccus mucosus]|uniref:hypothetical protein n=1 Tax=Termitidicoccus mucosus TaxID=1184151 RepID=UPI000B31507C
MKPSGNLIFGLIFAFFVLVTASFWAFWGASENFHEAWHYKSIFLNLKWTLAYLAPSAAFVGLGVLGIKRPVIGGATICVLAGALMVWWLMERWPPSPKDFIHVAMLSSLLLLAGGLLCLFGRVPHAALVVKMVIGVPALIAVACSVEPVWRIAHRHYDGDLGAREVDGQGTRLIWAPSGPGWDTGGQVSYAKAQFIATHLSADGRTVMDRPQGIWRLPAVDEIVRSLTRDGQNAGGVWAGETRRASYMRMPDKESPLWTPYAPVIYYWTQSPGVKGSSRWTICYNGRVMSRAEKTSMRSLGFRLVRETRTP